MKTKNIPLRTTRDLGWETKQAKEVYCLCQVKAQSVKNIAVNNRVKTVTFFFRSHFKAKLCMHLERGSVQQSILSRYSAFGDISSCVISYSLGSLSKDVFEQRTSTGSGLFSFMGSGLASLLHSRF